MPRSTSYGSPPGWSDRQWRGSLKAMVVFRGAALTDTQCPEAVSGGRDSHPASVHCSGTVAPGQVLAVTKRLQGG